ncbi:2-hydroxycarboxylate transporter family protein [Candidatus Phytoplasma melaleucae]|uniref:2-hydroxycarboxylate transporter family protein n=1 Tax=Candidatus Phytoplasma melaleucae TaxID=2982630 RepID=A0ABT9DCU6_9MOLU|nr:2-hydroxycarboxylate transporter family protein ['Melaleuca sp.' phytoplasma]MDO8167925.1 2-hydroxycarboxylate transporter family protein ['Melaleuca sp.' phytoplasma]
MINLNHSEKQNVSKNNIKPKIDILGFPLSLIMIILVITIMHIWIAYDASQGIFTSSWHHLISVLLFTMVLAEILKVIGKKTPILKDIGGGAILCLLVPAFIFNYNFFPSEISNRFFQFQAAFREKISYFNKNSSIGFSELFVSSLVCGSLLGIRKDILKRNGIKFLSLVIVSLFISAIVVGIAGILFRPIGGINTIPNSSYNNFLNSIFYIFVPISCGGLTCGIIPLVKVFSQGIPIYEDFFKTHIITSLLIGGIISVIFGGLIKKIFGNSKYGSPNGDLEKLTVPDQKNLVQIQKKSINHTKNSTLIEKTSLSRIKTGLVAIFALYIFSNVLRFLLLKLVLSENIAKYLPPTIIFLVLLVLLVKFFDLISDNYVQSISQASQFITQTFSSCILVVVGVNINIGIVMNKMVDLAFLSTCILCVGTTALVAAIIGNKVGFYPVQSSIAAGLCANSIGGAGNIAILEASNALKLTPYAQIATRIGGDLTVIIASIVFPLFYSINPGI